jgi:hypothetical protein
MRQLQLVIQGRAMRIKELERHILVLRAELAESKAKEIKVVEKNE